MAKYDRRILLPYLRDLYSVEILSLVQQKEYKQLRKKTEQYERKLEEDLEPEQEENTSSVVVIFLCFMAMMFCGVSILMGVLAIRNMESLWILSAIFLAAGCLSLIPLVIKWREYRTKRSSYDKYCMEVLDYNNRAPEREKLKKHINECKKQMTSLIDRSGELQSLKMSLYGANVLPAHFRNLSTVRFLFDYFRTSKADDVDMVLQIYALEELKNNLEGMTNRQAIAILRQRASLAEQVMTDPLQRQSYEQQVRQIAAQNQNEGLQEQYLKMISCNLEVSNYFVQYGLETET